MIPTIIAIYLFAVGYGIFRRFNMGLARNSRGQQLRRYLIAAVQVVIPMLLMRQSSFSLPAVCALLTATLWIVTYNVLYDISPSTSGNRATDCLCAPVWSICISTCATTSVARAATAPAWSNA